jgi:hypothetical protein
MSATAGALPCFNAASVRRAGATASVSPGKGRCSSTLRPTRADTAEYHGDGRRPVAGQISFVVLSISASFPARLTTVR